MRIGIHTGEVIAGNMGSSELFNSTVLGDTVNLASRLEAANKAFGTEILISHAVHTRAGSRITARPLGRIEVKGRTAEVEVLELLGTNTATESRHPSPAACTHAQEPANSDHAPHTAKP